jgi:hypothetical protein
MDDEDDISFDTQPEVVSGAWHLLCVGVMSQAVHRLAAENNLFNNKHYSNRIDGGGACKERNHQKVQAREWLKGGVGLVTYEDCCEEMGVDPARAREKIMAWCRTRKRIKLPPPEYYGGGDDQEDE